MKKKWISIMLAAALCAGSLAGCGGGQEAGDTGSTGTKASGTQAGDGGASGTEDGEPLTVTVGVAQQFTTLDPGLSTETVNRFAIAHMYAGLYKKLEDGSVVPELAAAEPEISEDGLTYTIKLKEGLTWSDGSR